MTNFLQDWSITAASNGTVGGINIAEGCSAANLNNGMRAIMADLALWRDATTGAKTTTGSANAYVLTTGLSLSALARGQRVTAKLNFANTAACTLAVDSLAATSIKLPDGSDPAAGALPSGGVHEFVFDGTYWQVMNPFGADADLGAIGALSGTAGMLAKTAANTWALRTLTGPAAGLSVSNGTGASGDPTLALANDLAALEALASTGLAARTGSDTWAQRTVTGTAPITVTNGSGAAGDPTIAADVATAANYRANTATKLLQTDNVWSAADYVALTDAATVAVDMSTGINFSVTLGGNRTLGAPSSTKNGQSGMIVITQDGTGSRTLAYNAAWKFAGGTAPVLTTTAAARDVLVYQVISSSVIWASLVKDVK